MPLVRRQPSSRGERYKLTVFVNDVQVKVLDVDPAAGSQSIDVPRRFLKPGEKGKQRVNFQIAGRGRYTYQCILGGFVPADKLKSTTGSWRVERYYEPAPLELDGREIPRGFGVLEGEYQTFRNPLDQLPVGRRGMVNIELWRNVAWNTPEERLEYLVVTEPIPSGTTVIEKSVTRPVRAFRDRRRARSPSTSAAAPAWARSTTSFTATCRASTASARRSSATPTGPSSFW